MLAALQSFDPAEADRLWLAALAWRVVFPTPPY
jgi:hypothetical protein